MGGEQGNEQPMDNENWERMVVMKLMIFKKTTGIINKL